MDPFFIQLHDPRRGTEFASMKVLFKLKSMQKDEFNSRSKSLRLAVYSFLKSVAPQDFLRPESRDKISMRLLKRINSELYDSAVADVRLTEMHFVKRDNASGVKKH